MKTFFITVTLFILLGVALAIPAPSLKKRSSHKSIINIKDHKEIRQSHPASFQGNAVELSHGSHGGGGPYIFLRSPRYFQQEAFDNVAESEEYWTPKGRAYKVNKKNQKISKKQRDSEEDEEDNESVADDEEDEDEEQDEGFDTPTWEKVYPPKEQGEYGQASRRPTQRGDGPPPPQQRRIRYGAPAPGMEVEVPGVVGPPAGRGRSGIHEESGRSLSKSNQIPKDFRVRPVTLRVVSPRQYNFGFGSSRRPQNYYGNDNRRTQSPSWDSYEPQRYPSYPSTSRRSWGYGNNGDYQNSANSGSSGYGPRPVFHMYQHKKSNSGYNSYPYMPVSGYQGRSDSFQGRRNNKIPVYYSQPEYYYH